MSLAIRGNDFIFFQYQQGNIGAHRLKMDPKIDTFGQFDTRVWNILSRKKVVFWTFLKFGKFLRIVFGRKMPTFGCSSSLKG